MESLEISSQNIPLKISSQIHKLKAILSPFKNRMGNINWHAPNNVQEQLQLHYKHIVKMKISSQICVMAMRMYKR